MGAAEIFNSVQAIVSVVVVSFSYLYSQRSVIHKTWFNPIVKLVTLILIYYSFIIFFDLIKSVNPKDYQIEFDFNKYVNDFYFIVVLMARLYLLWVIIDFMELSFQYSNLFKNFSGFWGLIRLWVIRPSLVIFGLWIGYKYIYGIEKSIIIEIVIMSVLVIVSIIAFAFFKSLISEFFQGHIKINMENIYSKSGAQIPVFIEITGVNDELSIDLRQIFENKVNQIDKITLGPNLNDVNIAGIYLIGNGSHSGLYHVFINTTNMTEGYYELKCSRLIDKYPYGKSFYLVNSGSGGRILLARQNFIYFIL